MRRDEFKHFIGCIIISWFVMLLFHLQWSPIMFVHRQSYNWDARISMLVSTFIAGAKELVWDKWLGLGTPQPYDFFWGFVGAVVGPAIWLIVETMLGVAMPFPW